MPRYRIHLAYDGTDYSGWQVQPNSDTIQARLEQALARMAKRPISIVGSGRTDAGVHAEDQVAHFDLPGPIPCQGLLRGLNSLLPANIRVMIAAESSPKFHARYDVVRKIYRYHLDCAEVPQPLRTRFTWHFPFALDRAQLELAARDFVGEHDFAGFRASSCRAKTTRRRITDSRFLVDGNELIYEVSGSGFLQHMVRNMVGTLIEVGRTKRPASDIAQLLADGDRRLAGPTAPPEGLVLYRVYYPDDESPSTS